MDFFELRMDVEWYRYLAAYGKKEEKPAKAKLQELKRPEQKEQDEHKDHHHNAA